MDFSENRVNLRRASDICRKPILTARNPAITKLLDSLPLELPERRNDLHTWTDNLIGDVTRWSGQRRRAGLFGSEVLRRFEAAAALAKALREAGETANDL